MRDVQTVYGDDSRTRSHSTSMSSDELHLSRTWGARRCPSETTLGPGCTRGIIMLQVEIQFPLVRTSW